MDEIAMAAGTALAAAATTESWSMVKAAVVNWWRRFHPDEAVRVETDLERLRTEVIDARTHTDTDAEQAITSEWRLRLQRLINTDPRVRDDLRQLLEEQIYRALNEEDRQRAQSLIQRTTVVGDNNHTIVAGGDVHGTSSTSPQ